MSSHQKFTTTNGADIMFKLERPTSAVCAFCLSPLSGKWQMRKYCLCGDCLLRLTPAQASESSMHCCWVMPAKDAASSYCNGCNVLCPKASLGLFWPHSARCSSCAAQGRGSELCWHTHDGSAGASSSSSKQQSAAIGKALKVANAVGTLGMSVLEGMNCWQLSAMAQAYMEDGVLDPQEATNMVLAAAGPKDNVVETSNAVSTHDPAPTERRWLKVAQTWVMRKVINGLSYLISNMFS